MKNTWFNSLSPTDIIITANHRLTIFLRADFNRYQLENGKKAWISPTILPFSTWLSLAFTECNENGFKLDYTLLSDHQSTLVWEKIITQTQQQLPLLRLRATAINAKKTWDLLQQWTYPAQQLNASTEDIQQFKQWAKHYATLCSKNKWIDQANLPTLFTEAILEQHYAAPKKIWLVGFEQESPQLSKLIAALKQMGTDITFVLPTETTTKRSKVLCNTVEEEIFSLATWAKQQWENNPQHRIGCIVPKLNEHRSLIKRIFTEVFAPQNLFKPSVQDLPFNISLGEPLNTYPLIHSALQLLELNAKSISIETAGNILRSPFLQGAKNEKSKRANLYQLLCLVGSQFISRSDMINYAKQNSISSHCPNLATILMRFEMLIPPENKALSAQEWADLFSEQLKTVGWPGQYTLSSHEFQTQQRWQELIQEFGQLGAVTQALSYKEAYLQLHYLAQEILFQPKGSPSTIQILGLFEAVGLSFDKTWIMHLDDETWPSSPTPNPFIPHHLQSQLKMPHCNAEHELQFSQQILEHISNNSTEITASYHSQELDKKITESSLIKDWPLINLPKLYVTKLADQLYYSNSTEEFEDGHGPHLSPTEIIHGGTRILKEQAACPIRAFALFRLGATEIELPHLGFDHLERGSTLHNALENIWIELKTQQRLCELSEVELQAIIKLACENALVPLISKRTNSIPTRFHQIELERMQQLITKFLELEKQREPFEILATEKEHSITLGELTLKMRVDRIDQLEDGSKIIIDYKTGKTSINDWFGTRLTEPQLPVYFLSEENVNGVVFAQLRINDLQFKGLCQHSAAVPGTIPLQKLQHETLRTWDDLFQLWQVTLTELSEQFSNGIAKVDPKDQIICQRCNLQGICRVYDYGK